jgi:hypothetical protein
MPHSLSHDEARDNLADITGWRAALEATMLSMHRISELMPIDLASQVQDAAARVEQAIDELDAAARPLADEVNRAECKLERRHERESAPVVL